MKEGLIPNAAMPSRTERSNRLIATTRTPQATGEVQKSGVRIEPTRQPSAEPMTRISPGPARIESSSKPSRPTLAL